MAYEMREGQGSLFKNNLRDKETQPNARGEALIGGVVYEVAAWTKKDKNGNPWQSLAFKVKAAAVEQQTRTQPAKTTGTKFDDMDDDLPFTRCDLDSDVIFRKLHWGNDE